MYADDTSRIINVQMMLFDEDTFLNDILRDDGFQKDPSIPDPNLKSAWPTCAMGTIPNSSGKT